MYGLSSKAALAKRHAGWTKAIDQNLNASKITKVEKTSDLAIFDQINFTAIEEKKSTDLANRVEQLESYHQNIDHQLHIASTHELAIRECARRPGNKCTRDEHIGKKEIHRNTGNQHQRQTQNLSHESLARSGTCHAYCRRSPQYFIQIRS